MDIINGLMVATQTGFWANIITAFESFVLDYAWAVILLTICIKVVTFPMDFLNKKNMRDTTRMQTVIGPQLAKLQKQFANDRQKLNQKTTELYKANNFNVMGSCFVMLINMALTMVIFITLFTGLISMSHFKVEEQYLTLKQTYEQTLVTTADENKAKEAVVLKYDEVKNSFLWVQNIWVADSAFVNTIPTFNEYIGIIGDTVKTDFSVENVSYKEMTDADKQAFEAEYNKVMGVLSEQGKGGVNGYFITTLLAVAVSFLSQYLMQRKTAIKNNASANGTAPAPNTNKVMLILLPLIMGVITLFYNAIFGLYIIAGQIVSLVTFPLIDAWLDKIYAKKDREMERKNTAEYSRKFIDRE